MKTKKHLKSGCYNSPIGEIFILADGEKLCYLDFGDKSRRKKLLKARYGDFSIAPERGLLEQLGLQERLNRYFARDWNAFKGLDFVSDGTDFRCKVWNALKKISAGKTMSYGEVADSIGSPGAARSVGGANGNNPIPIIVPCHRVIGIHGELRGYTGGIERQYWLLGHEGAKIR